MIPPNLRRRLARWSLVLIPVAILTVILVSVGTVGFVEVSSQPGFCNSCHIMEPYYESWATSSHREVTCIECHIPPGVRSEVRQKIQAANMVVRYFTGAYDTRPWAEISDASCTRSGCHSQRLIEGEVDYRGVRFDHAEHLGEVRRGMQLHCTSCHSQIVQGTHIAVTETTCVLCHFKGRDEGRPIAGCTGCHSDPPSVRSPGGLMVDHAEYVRNRVDCLSCHNEVTHGTGDADESRCVSCHNEPERLAEFDDPTLLHQVHVSDRNIACVQCHTSIQHEIVALTGTIELDCEGCHRSVHQDEQRLLAGVGGHGVESMPSSMFLARVSCVACHDHAQELAGHDTVRVANEASCLSCHGIQYADVLPGWQREMERKVALVAPVVAAAQSAAATVPLRRRAVADSLLGLAGENVEFVREGKGAHNVVYADQLLRASLGLVRDAVSSASLPYRVPAVDLGPPVSENACLQCHLSASTIRGTFQGASFNHTSHVLQAGLQCSTCHTPLSDHGGTTLTSVASCNACHHPLISPGNCARCHEGPGGAPQSVVSMPTGDFSHSAHVVANLACTSCHTAPVMNAGGLDCESCHEAHHQPEMQCLSCHRDGALALHVEQNHTTCIQCHAAVPGIDHWTRQVCTSCHADRTDHNPGQSCQVCHQIPAMGETTAAAAPPLDRYIHAAVAEPPAAAATGG